MMQRIQPSRRLILGGLGALGAAGPAAFAQPRPVTPAFKVEPDREQIVAVRGGRIYVRVNGDLAGPRPPVLMIHGGPGGEHVSFLTALPLTEVRAVILYDQLDCGLSERPKDIANWTVERFVSEIDAIREALRVKSLHIVGHSWGGTLAAEYAARQPQGLKSVVLQGAFLSAKRWAADAEQRMVELPDRLESSLRRCLPTGFPASDPDCTQGLLAYYRSYNGRAPAPDYVNAYYRTIRDQLARGDRAPGPDIYKTMWGPNEISVTGTLKSYEGEGLLSKINVPTLYLGGEFDEVTPATNATYAAQTRLAELQTLPGLTHSAQFDDPDGYVRALHSWLTRRD